MTALPKEHMGDAESVSTGIAVTQEDLSGAAR